MNKEREALKNIINNDNCVNDGGTYISEIYEYEFNIIDKALTKLERLEIEHRTLKRAYDIANMLNKPKFAKLERIEAIDLDEVQEQLNAMETLLKQVNRGLKLNQSIQNLINTLRGVKDE